MACLFFILMHFKDGKGFLGKVGFIAWIIKELICISHLRLGMISQSQELS
jgi:hypothetical protein